MNKEREEFYDSVAKEIADLLAKKDLSFSEAEYVLDCAQAEIKNFKLK